MPAGVQTLESRRGGDAPGGRERGHTGVGDDMQRLTEAIETLDEIAERVDLLRDRLIADLKALAAAQGPQASA
mgnify:CR=1 FL=1